MNRRKFFGLIALSWICAIGTSFAQTSMAQYLTNQELIARGKEVYEKRCSGCHGLNGKAEQASPFLNPKPRNFTDGIYKFRSTEYGTLPTDEDLLRTITQGVFGTSMPEFRLLSETKKLAVVQYIKTFYPKWEEEGAGRVINIPPIPDNRFEKGQKEKFMQHARAGREVFAMACTTCHGYRGEGDGPASATLVDPWNQPVKPVDLTIPYVRSGPGARDLYKVMATGVGTMPAFADVLGEEKTWDLVSYVLYLRGEEAGMYPRGTIPEIEDPRKNPGSASSADDDDYADFSDDDDW